MDGQTHEDKTQEYLEKQLIESWERTIDRNEVKNLWFFSPREFTSTLDDKSDPKEGVSLGKSQLAGGADIVDGFGAGPYIDADYV